MKANTENLPKARAARETAVIPPDLAAMSTAELRRELSSALELTAAQLARLALIVRALEDRGEDLSDLRLGLLTYLRRIAYGQLLPELVVRFASSPVLLRYAAALPLPDQSRLSSGEPLTLVTRDLQGKVDLRLVDPVNLSAPQIRQILGPDGLRDEAQQVALLERSGKPLEPTAPPRKVGKVRADRSRVGLIVGRTFIPASLAVEALAQIRDQGVDPATDLTATVAFRLSESERVALHSAAGRADLSMAAMVRRTLLAAGLLSASEGQ